MTPPCKIFKADALEAQVQTSLVGTKRKTEGGRDIDLSQCPLFGMLQYDCQIDRPELPNSPVKCWPVQRWFRRCQDRKGEFMVETTSWEGRLEKDIEDVPPAAAQKGTGFGGRGWTSYSWRERETDKHGQYREI
ncbi:uncharacterized protein JN550_007479 [Neoarthrinium moseri]|uniref:uncharacterized protein n=1 Tax=Neoarthrinium moseri TaxID=1658444 RepID=UPI001FDDF28E|nr:uncharacterized protein JN550_007479 [Neoarthrinium moseri]KAI1866626.1 hypothetical protein JN550_007479 [Neoarthrinium moseri]